MLQFCFQRVCTGETDLLEDVSSNTGQQHLEYRFPGVQQLFPTLLLVLLSSMSGLIRGTEILTRIRYMQNSLPVSLCGFLHQLFDFLASGLHQG
mmetsp:Transcript_11062/g.21160  ORF Transcript_11062/g.21160 Transcript_11062/m.21160 type:complete len:94 (+) Transcript_11062:2250-2531(+)